MKPNTPLGAFSSMARFEAAKARVDSWTGGSLPAFPIGTSFQETRTLLSKHGFEILAETERPNPQRSTQHLFVSHPKLQMAGHLNFSDGRLEQFRLTGQWDMGARAEFSSVGSEAPQFLLLNARLFHDATVGMVFAIEAAKRQPSELGALLMDLAANGNPIRFEEWVAPESRPELPRGLYSQHSDMDLMAIKTPAQSKAAAQEGLAGHERFLLSLPKPIARAWGPDCFKPSASAKPLTDISHSRFGPAIRARCRAQGLHELSFHQSCAISSIAYGFSEGWVNPDWSLRPQKFTQWVEDHGKNIPGGLNPLHLLCIFGANLSETNSREILGSCALGQIRSWAHGRCALWRSPMMLITEMFLLNQAPASPERHGVLLALLDLLGPEAYPPHDPSLPGPVTCLLEDALNAELLGTKLSSAIGTLQRAMAAGCDLQLDGTALLIDHDKAPKAKRKTLPWSDGQLSAISETYFIDANDASARLFGRMTTQASPRDSAIPRAQAEETILRIFSCVPTPGANKAKPLAL